MPYLCNLIMKYSFQHAASAVKILLTVIMMAIGSVSNAQASSSQPQVGVLAASDGLVQLRNASSELLVINPGAPIHLYDEIITGDNTRAQILMRDETTFSVGANTEVIIDEFIFDPADHANGLIKANFKKGVFRFISGRIAKANPVNMEVKAGNAVIAVRGTEVIGTISAETSTIVLLSGQIDMTSVSEICQSGGAGCAETLTRPGFGVAFSAAGQFSAPTRFDPEEINAVIGTLQINPLSGKDNNDADDEPASEEPANDEDDAATSLGEDAEDAEASSLTTADNNDDKPEDNVEPEQLVEVSSNTADEKPDDDAVQGADVPATTLTVTRSDGTAVINLTNVDDVEAVKSEDFKPEDLKPEDLQVLDINTATLETATQTLDDDKPDTVVLRGNLNQTTNILSASTPLDADEKLEDKDARQKRLSDFDLIVMRALGVIADPSAPAVETPNMDLPQDLVTTRDNDDKTVAEEPDERELTEEAYEEEVEEAVNELSKDQEKEEENTSTSQNNNSNNNNNSNTASNTAPTLTLGRLGNTDDTANDDTFSPVNASASGTDTDSADTLTFGLTGVTQTSNIAGFNIVQEGSYGHLHLNTSSGAYRYIPDDEATEGLTSTVNESFEVTLTDGTDTVRSNLGATLRGVNDTPVLAVITGSTVTDTAADDSFSDSTGTLDGSDRDDGQTLTYGITSGSADNNRNGYTHALNGSYGTLYLNSTTGAYVYEPDDSKIEELKTTVTDTFAMTVSDGAAGHRQNYRVTINGANDTPSLNAITGMTFTDTAAADSFSNQTGSLSGSDRDRNETLTYGIDGGTSSSLSGYTDAYVGTYGTLHVNSSSGAYVYVPDSDAIEDLKTSQTDQFTLTVSDGSLSSSQTLTTAIDGVNDTPILGSISGVSFTDTSGDDSFSNVTATASATDADAGETITYGITGGSADTSLSGYTHSSSGSYGTLYINSTSGAYTYVIDDTAMEGAASTVTDSFTVSASDGTASSTSNFVATIDGANDTPILASISSITVTDTNADDSFSNTSASLSGSDRDTGASLTYSITGGSADTSLSGFTHSSTGTYGTLYIEDTTGDYRFVPNDTAVEELTSTVTEDFTIQLSDGSLSTTQTLTTTLQGVNDAPTLAAFAGISLVDTAANDSFSNTTGTASGSDRDSGQTVSFNLPNGGADTSRSGYTHAEAGTYGTLYFNSTNGNYTYIVNNRSVQARKTDDSDQFTVEVSDGALTATQTLTASVTGVNDTPVIGSLSGFTLADTSAPDSFTAQAGAANADDVDAGDVVTFGISGGSADNSDTDYTHSISGTYGMLQINSTSGAYRFLPNATAIDGATTTVTESFTITASDGSLSASTDLVATITGVDDTPILQSLQAISVQDTVDADTFSNVTRTASGNNPDNGQTETYGITGGSSDTSVSGYTHSRSGTYGTIYINSASGAYQYVPNTSAIEALTSTQSENFELTFSDGITTVQETLSTSLAGVNDRPTLAAMTGVTINDTADDDTFTNQSGTAVGSDADTGTTFKYAFTNMVAVSGVAGFTHMFGGTYGDLYLNQSTGAYEYRPHDRPIEELTTTATDTFNFEVSDGTISSTQQALTFTINGVDDKPVINVGNGAITLSTGSAGAQTATVTDVEGHTISDISNTVAALPGWLNFATSNNGGTINYFWEVTSATPTWLNGSRDISFKARANGLDSDTATATFTFQCQTDLCSQFVQSTDATNPVAVNNATDVQELISKDELTINEDIYTLMDSTQINNLFDTSGSDTGSFRVLYTANEGSGISNPGTWEVDQSVNVDYSKREITIQNSYEFNNIQYFNGNSGSFNYNRTIDTSDPNSAYSGKDSVFQSPTVVDTGLDINSSDIRVTINDHIAFLNDGASTDAATIWTTVNPHSSNQSGFNDDSRALTTEEWRVLEPQ